MKVLPVAAHARTVGDCQFCPKMCRFACPVAEAEASEAATPAWKSTLARLYLRGEASLAGAVAESAYKCTDCLLSRTYCLHGHQVPDAYAAVRSAAFAAGVAPEAARRHVERVRRLGNPFEEDLAGRLVAIAGPGDLLAPGARAGVALFPGCTAVRHAPDVIRDARSVFAGVERAPLKLIFPEGGCCGYPLYEAGDLEGFAALARKAAAALGGVGEVISLDPGCVHAMNVLWKKVGIDLGGRARTLVERLHERLDAVRAAVRRPIDGETFSYHDPCYLGRYRGVYDAPRALLAAASAGRPPLEFAWARERSWCSGAGAVYARVHPASAARIRGRRLAEHAETGAGRLTTACPSALRMLGKGLPPERPPLDVVSVLAIAFGARER